MLGIAIDMRLAIRIIHFYRVGIEYLTDSGRFTGGHILNQLEFFEYDEFRSFRHELAIMMIDMFYGDTIHTMGETGFTGVEIMTYPDCI